MNTMYHPINDLNEAYPGFNNTRVIPDDVAYGPSTSADTTYGSFLKPTFPVREGSLDFKLIPSLHSLHPSERPTPHLRVQPSLR